MNKLNIILKKYEKDGFIILKNFITKKEIDVFEKKLFEIYSNNLKAYVNKKNVHKVIISSEKNKLYDQLYLCYNKYIISRPYKNIQKKFLLFSKKLFKKNYKYLKAGMAIGIRNSSRTAYDWHQEKSYYNIKNTIHFQFPIISPATKNNGTMSVLASSHNLGEIKKIKNIKKSKKSINTLKPNNINQIKKNYKEKFIKMKLGDVCMFNENIIHKTNKNYSKNVRLVPIIRFKPSNK